MIFYLNGSKFALRKKHALSFLLFSILVNLVLFQNSIANCNGDPDFEEYWDNNLVLFFGPGLESEFTVSLEAIRNGSYQRIENTPFTRINKMNNSLTFDISGSLLWDILNSSSKLMSNATYVQFAGEDSYGYGPSFVKLPIRIIENSSNQIYLTTHQDGSLISKDEGPIRVEVEMSAIENDGEMIAMYEDLFEEGENFVHNSKLSAQRLAAVYISDQPTGYEQDNVDDDTSDDDSSDDDTSDDDSETSDKYTISNDTFLFPIGILLGIFLLLQQPKKKNKQSLIQRR